MNLAVSSAFAQALYSKTSANSPQASNDGDLINEFSSVSRSTTFSFKDIVFENTPKHFNNDDFRFSIFFLSPVSF